MATFVKNRFNIDEDYIVAGITKILMVDDPTKSVRRSMDLLFDSGWLEEVFPELNRMACFRTRKSKSKDLWKHVLQVVENCPKDPVLRWAALMHDIGKPVVVRDRRQGVTFHGHEAEGAKIWKAIAKRINAPELFTDAVATIIRESGSFVELKDANITGKLTDTAIRRYVNRVGPAMDDIFRFTLADMTSKWDRKLDKMRTETRALMRRIDELEIADKIEAARPRLPKGTGTILMEKLGLKGKMLGGMMAYLQKGLDEGELSVDDDFVEVAEAMLKDTFGDALDA